MSETFECVIGKWMLYICCFQVSCDSIVGFLKENDFFKN